MRKLLCVLIIASMALILPSCGFLEETGKGIEKTFLGGLKREITVYEPNGNVIATYRGRINIHTHEEGNGVTFIYDGKQIEYYNCAIEVVEILDDEEEAVDSDSEVKG